MGNGVDILDDQYLTIIESIDFWSNFHDYDIVQIDTVLSGVSVRKVYSNNSTLSEFEHIQVIGGGHLYFYGDSYGFSSSQEAIDFSSQYKLSDFIANYEDTDNNGLFNLDDINVVIDFLFDMNDSNVQFDFNSDQNVDIFDVLTLSDFIY